MSRAPTEGSVWSAERFRLRLIAGCGLAAMVVVLVVLATVLAPSPAKPTLHPVQVPFTFVMQAGDSQWVINATQFCPPYGSLPGATVFFNWSSQSNQTVGQFNVLKHNASLVWYPVYWVYNLSHGGGSFPALCYVYVFGVNSSTTTLVVVHATLTYRIVSSAIESGPWPLARLT